MKKMRLRESRGRGNQGDWLHAFPVDVKPTAEHIEHNARVDAKKIARLRRRGEAHVTGKA